MFYYKNTCIQNNNDYKLNTDELKIYHTNYTRDNRLYYTVLKVSRT
mgnify:CR=1 FL=1